MVGAAVSIIRCPQCDQSIVSHEDDVGTKLRCPRCSRMFVVERWTGEHAGQAANDIHFVPRYRALRWIAQRLTNFAAWAVLQTCPGCGTRTRRTARLCARCGRVLRKPGLRRLGRREWRTIAVAVLVFVGTPAALIFFLVVFCAPRPR